MHNYTKYHQAHDLERVEGEKGKYYHCKKCLIEWNNRPRPGSCLGVPRYNVRKNRPAHLFTRKELLRKHLKPGSEPEGYVYIINSPYWIFLYDINKAVVEAIQFPDSSPHSHPPLAAQGMIY
jgi:hypothetical protein